MTVYQMILNRLGYTNEPPYPAISDTIKSTLYCLGIDPNTSYKVYQAETNKYPMMGSDR